MLLYYAFRQRLGTRRHKTRSFIFFILNAPTDNLSLVPASNSNAGTVLDFNPGYALDCNRGPTIEFDFGRVLDYVLGPGSRFCSPFQLQFRGPYLVRFIRSQEKYYYQN
ncbi:hypothetical protein EVAR_70816_1 [Eumeta japonica]|uniref:Uncharacterized protein n=1 Tax=Eumeta variegata TaxID=151549 RepID=A0A4C2A5M8_EUMVA|nr:hypothetical protein EVAR_70816_1 [Eumeta japonica]